MLVSFILFYDFLEKPALMKKISDCGRCFIAVNDPDAVGGQVLNALGVEVFFIADENGSTGQVRFGGESALSDGSSPPELSAGCPL